MVPLTEDQQVVFVRQFLFGTNALTLEIPGGMCDEGEQPRASALRELCEETGYETSDLVDLGWVHPNPAIQSNRCHTLLAKNIVRVGDPTPDGDEAFEIAAFYRMGLTPS